MFFARWLTTLVLVTFASIPLCSAEDVPPPPEYAKNSKDVVYFIPQFSDFTEVNEHDRLFLKQKLQEAADKKVKAVIFELDTPGGRIDVALKYLTILSKAEVPTIAYVHKGISAGAIIALGADRIAIHPDGMIGDAMPIQMGPDGIKPIVEKPEEVGEKEKAKEKKKSDDSIAKADKEEEIEKSEEDKEEETVEDSTLRKILEELEDIKGDRKKTPAERKLADQKFLTVFFKTLQVLAEKNDRPVRIVRAMADPYQKLTRS